MEESSSKLTNPPLMEVMFELRWKLKELTGNRTSDPAYSLLVGKLYDELREDYPSHEQLPTAEIPAEIASYVIQHRFRKTEGGWPLVQIGPGVLTINDDTDYDWPDFNERINKVVPTFLAAHESLGGTFEAVSVQLRYIDGLPFDFTKDSILSYLDTMLKVKIELLNTLFDDGKTSTLPKGIDLRFFFECNNPEAELLIRFARGKKKEEDALVWETVVGASPAAIPQSPGNIATWADSAHELIHTWFVKLTDGQLMENFK